MGIRGIWGIWGKEGVEGAASFLEGRNCLGFDLAQGGPDERKVPDPPPCERDTKHLGRAPPRVPAAMLNPQVVLSSGLTVGLLYGLVVITGAAPMGGELFEISRPWRWCLPSSASAGSAANAAQNEQRSAIDGATSLAR